MPLTNVMAHASFSEERRLLLPSIVASWQGGVQAVVEDDRRRGSWFTVRAAWHEALRLSGGQGHLIVSQDDYAVASGGFERMQAVCDLNPGEVLCFRWPAVSEQWMHSWVERDDAFFGRSSFAWTGGALCVPAPIVADFLEWSREFDSLLTRPYPQHDDTRAELHFMARGHEVLRCRWSLLRHLGKWSVCRNAEREGDDEELGLVGDVSELPPIDDPRWVVSDDVPSAVYAPAEFKATVEVLLGRNADKVGLGHVRTTLVG